MIDDLAHYSNEITASFVASRSTQRRDASTMVIPRLSKTN